MMIRLTIIITILFQLIYSIEIKAQSINEIGVSINTVYDFNGIAIRNKYFKIGFNHGVAIKYQRKISNKYYAFFEGLSYLNVRSEAFNSLSPGALFSEEHSTVALGMNKKVFRFKSAQMQLGMSAKYRYGSSLVYHSGWDLVEIFSLHDWGAAPRLELKCHYLKWFNSSLVMDYTYYFYTNAASTSRQRSFLEYSRKSIGLQLSESISF